MKPTVYVETSVISYYRSRPSRDVIVAGNQLYTHEWWEKILPTLEQVTSAVVLLEIQQGDPEQAKARLEAIRGWKLLPKADLVAQLAEEYLRRTSLPPKSERDAYHLAYATFYEIDYLVTWNCSHFANAHIRRHLIEINEHWGLSTPVICIPLELLGNEPAF